MFAKHTEESCDVVGGVPVDVINPVEAKLTRRPTILVCLHDGAMVFGSRKTAATIYKILARYAIFLCFLCIS